MGEKVRILFLRDARPGLQVEKGANLMRSLQQAGLPVASSCDGDGVCAKCRMQILEGASHLNPPNETEIFLRDRFQLKPQERISCQCQVNGDIRIHASYW